MDKAWVWPSVAKTQKAPLSRSDFTLQWNNNAGNMMFPGPTQSRESFEPVAWSYTQEPTTKIQMTSDLVDKN